jgi:hypothetical protein
MNKLSADLNRRMLATGQFTIFLFPAFKNLLMKYTQNYDFTCCFDRAWNLVFQLKIKSIDWKQGDKRTFYVRDSKWEEAEEKCIMRSFIICTLYQAVLELPNQEGWDGWHVELMTGMINAYQILIQKHEGKRPLWR